MSVSAAPPYTFQAYEVIWKGDWKRESEKMFTKETMTVLKRRRIQMEGLTKTRNGESGYPDL